ncbi:hypothetical protein MNBD_DELTA03-1043 [hydrothermal vent metagenome]|uniref:Uncharacterized protein n=1 Tax=hydrothermal vent metagenome TaxID=652676 RepID=A0A3B0UVM0_9ZZZZ
MNNQPDNNSQYPQPLPISFARKQMGSGPVRPACLTKYGYGYYLFWGNSMEQAFNKMVEFWEKRQRGSNESLILEMRDLDQYLVESGFVPPNKEEESQRLAGIINQFNNNQPPRTH